MATNRKRILAASILAAGGWNALKERDDLEVTLVEARGGDAAAALGVLLEKTGFFAQSALLGSAFDGTG